MQEVIRRQFNLSLMIIGLEMRKLFAYRVDFWFGFLGVVVCEIVVAYFVWKAVFTYHGVEVYNGYTFNGMMYYFLVAPILFHGIQSPTQHNVSEDIYQGYLTRYIIYPVSYMWFQILRHMVHTAVAFLQLVLVLSIFAIFFEIPKDVHLSLASVIMFGLAMFLGSVLYFLLSLCTEMVAFWQDNVWSLNVTIRLLVRFLAGGMVPLSFFPSWAISIIKLSPFYGGTGLAMEISRGGIATSDFAVAIGITLFWIIVVFYIARSIWERGKYIYTGVGI